MSLADHLSPVHDVSFFKATHLCSMSCNRDVMGLLFCLMTVFDSKYAEDDYDVVWYSFISLLSCTINMKTNLETFIAQFIILSVAVGSVTPVNDLTISYKDP